MVDAFLWMPVLLLLQVVKEIAPAGFLPITLVGWLTTVGLIIGFALQFIAMGRFLEKLNGLGKRINDHIAESDARVTALEVRENERVRAMDSLANSMGNLTRDVVAATLLIESCNEKDENLSRLLNDKLDKMREAQGRDAKDVGERLARLETATRLTVRLRAEEERRHDDQP